MSRRKDLLAAYSDHQRAQGLSEETVRRRTVSLSSFARFCHPLPIERAPLDLVEEWLRTIPTASTRKAYRSDLSSFYRWAVKRRLAPTNPVEDTDRIRVPKGLPRPIDRTFVADLIHLAPDAETAMAIALAAYAGLRRSEIARLDRVDISLHTVPATLLVKGKGNKERMVPVHPELARLLTGLPAGKVCPNKAQNIGKKVAQHLRAMGLDATLHSLRHTFATEAYRTSRDLRAVQELLGHESPTTTNVYAAMDKGHLTDVVGSMYDDSAA